MAFLDVPLLAMLKSRMAYLNQQQRGIAVNVANSDTPAFVPTTLQAFSYSAPGKTITPGGTLALAPVRTDPEHLPGRSAEKGPVWKSQSAPDSEARLDGNQVVLEEQMMKLNQARADHAAVTAFYTKSLSLLTLALKPPGKP